MHAHRIAIILAIACAACDSFAEGKGSDANDASVAETGVADAGTDAVATNDASTDAPVDAPTTADRATMYAQAVVSDQPIAYWRMGEPAGTTAADDAIGTNDAVLSATLNAPTFGPNGVFAPVSGALTFKGQSACFAHVTGLPFVGTAAFTVEAWIFIASPLDELPRHIVYHSNGSVSYGLFVQDSAGIGFVRNDNGTLTQVHTNAMAALNVWHHVVATRDGPTLALYVDGKAAGTAGGGIEATDAASSFYLGARSAGATSLPNGTRLAEVAIYKTALSVERIEAHRKIGQP